MKVAKSRFHQCKFQNHSRSSDLNKTWSQFDSFIGKNNKSSNVNESIINNGGLFPPIVIAKSFNGYFVNIPFKLASEASEELHNESLPSISNLFAAC